MFTKRHYEWLARWAGEHLTSDQWHRLAYDLGENSSRFKYETFIRACEKARARSDGIAA